jgi:hypothetical protein
MKIKEIIVGLFCLLAMITADAKGGFSGGGGRSGGFSSARPSTSYSSARPSQSYSAPRQTTTTVTRNTTINRTYNSRYVSTGGYYGGWGMGYHYNNGLMTGIIIGSMLHPMGSMMYMGPGAYYNNAMLYPNGYVVNQQGYQVGTYANGQFVPVNGGMVAQMAPQDAGQQPMQPAPAQQTIIVHEDDGWSMIAKVGLAVFLATICLILLISI